MEQAFTLTNEAFPLCVVCVLHIKTGPEVPKLKAALGQLQARHILLRAGISRKKGRLYFHTLDPLPEIGLMVADRRDADTWQGIAEEALNTTFDQTGPLMKCWYVREADQAASELIVCFHHAIIDGTAARLILHEILSLAGGIPLGPLPAGDTRPRYPADVSGLRLLKRFPGFALRQMVSEWQARTQGVGAPIPAHSRNALLSFRLSPELSRKLSLRVGREGLSLNTVLLAVMAQVVLNQKTGIKKGSAAHLISFADLRAGMVPPVAGEQLGCYASMVRFPVSLTAGQPPLQLAGSIRRALFQASRRGEVFIMNRISKYLIKMVVRLQNTRLGLSALSFIGVLDLLPRYGTIELHDVKAFITNNRLGPEFSAFGKILFGSIGLDFTYLTAEMEEPQAQKIIQEIKKILEKLAELPYI